MTPHLVDLWLTRKQMHISLITKARGFYEKEEREQIEDLDLKKKKRVKQAELLLVTQ